MTLFINAFESKLALNVGWIKYVLDNEGLTVYIFVTMKFIKIIDYRLW